MLKQKRYKIHPPVGNIVINKDVMTSKELRSFAMTMIEANDETWKDKIMLDPIEQVIEYLNRADYRVEEI